MTKQWLITELYLTQYKATVTDYRGHRRTLFFFSSRRRHTRSLCDWSSDVCSSDLRLLSTWKEGGPLDRLNRAAPGRDVPIGVETSELLARVFEWRARTGGAFDPTVLPLVRAWDLRGDGRVASPLEIARALEAVGPGHFALDAAGLARRLDPAAGIDEGAWGKGYALDRAGAALRERGVRRATL